MASDKKDHYDKKYERANYFKYKEWLYARYAPSLISFCHLPTGSSILDVGCGQGFFCHLFSKCGMKVHGIDVSETGIRQARNVYGHLGIEFEVMDINTASFPSKFDCIFVRSCSLYNTHEFRNDSNPTSTLLQHLREDGIFIFAYYSKLSSKRSPTWRYHSFQDVQKHFAGYRNAQIFFSSRLDTLFFGRHAFKSLSTRMNLLLSKMLGLGGDLICILKTNK